MKPHKHIIQLSTKELAQVQSTIRKGKHNARTITRARILLLSHRGGTQCSIADELGVNPWTVHDLRSRYRAGGLERALFDAPRPGQPKKISDAAEAHLIALATSAPPEGEERWTLELLRTHLVRDKKIARDITTVALWKRLTRLKIKPWREKNVVYSNDHPRVHRKDGRRA